MNKWKYTVRVGDVWHSDKPWEEKRDVLVSRVRGSHWYRWYEERGEFRLEEVLEEMQAANAVHWFDAALAELYDLADADRAWIATV